VVAVAHNERMEDHFESVEKLVTKRLKNFDYIKRVYQGSAPWMNTVFLTKEDIFQFYSKEKKDVVLQARYHPQPPPANPFVLRLI
jgi:hypothetical protein